MRREASPQTRAVSGLAASRSMQRSKSSTSPAAKRTPLTPSSTRSNPAPTASEVITGNPAPSAPLARDHRAEKQNRKRRAGFTGARRRKECREVAVIRQAKVPRVREPARITHLRLAAHADDTCDVLERRGECTLDSFPPAA